MDLLDPNLSMQLAQLLARLIVHRATRKFTKPMNTDEAKEYLNQVLMPLCEVYPNNLLYQTALTIAQDTGYSWYDSLIISSAKSANCSIIYSEDMHDGHKVSGLSIVNPFSKSL